MKQLLLLGLIIPALAPATVSAGLIGPGDFSSNARIVSYDNLGLPFVNGTPLVISGDSYATFLDSHLLYDMGWGQTVLGLSGGALATDAGHEILHIDLAADALKAGINVGAGAPWSATVTFYDSSHTLLGTEFLSGSGLDNEFAGWQADTGLVHELDIVDTSARIQNLFFKNLETDNAAANAVPEPASFMHFAAGLASLVIAGCQSRRR